MQKKVHKIMVTSQKILEYGTQNHSHRLDKPNS